MNLILKRLIETYLHQPYSWFLTEIVQILENNSVRNSTIMATGMTPLMELIAKGMVVPIDHYVSCN